MNLLLVVLGYKSVWLTSVLGREGWWGAVASGLFLLMLALSPLRPGRRWFLFPLAGFAFGSLADGALASAGGLVFHHETAWWGLPLWMPALWAAFAGAIPILLGGLRERKWSVALFGAVGGPLAYLGAARLGALHDFQPWAMACVAVEWAVFPVLVLTFCPPTNGRAITSPA